MRNALWMLMGLPASGKTYWFEHNQAGDNLDGAGLAVHLSMDDYRRVVMGHEFHKPNEPLVRGNFETFGRYLMSQKRYDIVLDFTSLRKGPRAFWMELAREFGYSVHGVFLNTPLETCLYRNHYRDRTVPIPVILNMFRTMHWPYRAEPDRPNGEPFDELRVIDGPTLANPTRCAKCELEILYKLDFKGAGDEGPSVRDAEDLVARKGIYEHWTDCPNCDGMLVDVGVVETDMEWKDNPIIRR